jgi:hypothetical protein
MDPGKVHDRRRRGSHELLDSIGGTIAGASPAQCVGNRVSTGPAQREAAASSESNRSRRHIPIVPDGVRRRHELTSATSTRFRGTKNGCSQ